MWPKLLLKHNHPTDRRLIYLFFFPKNYDAVIDSDLSIIYQFIYLIDS